MRGMLISLLVMSSFALLYGQEIPTDGLVAYYTFDNDVDTTIVDSSGNEAHGAFVGVVESRLQVEKWMRAAIDPQLVYVHAWQDGDLALWNNRSVCIRRPAGSRPTIGA